MYLYSINIDLCTSNYHIQVIDVRSYNKDSYYTNLSQPSNPAGRDMPGTTYLPPQTQTFQ